MLSSSYSFWPAGAAFTAFLGVLSHLLIWIHGEWDGVFWAVALCGIILHQVAVLTQLWLGRGLIEANNNLLALETSYSVGLFTSITIYRIFFHPLRQFPGPFWAKVWVWWRVKATVQSNERHCVMLHETHQRYGDFVRIGPNHLSIRLASAIPEIHGSSSGLTKAVAYENPINPNSVNADRDPVRHHLRRKEWDNAFAAKSCLDYVPRIISMTDLLVCKLQGLKASPTLVNDWCHFWTFDVMGTVGFGQSYRQLETGKIHPTIKEILNMMRIGVYMMMIPWLHCILSRLPSPGIEKADENFRVMARKALEERLKSTPSAPDVMSHLYRSNDKPRLTMEDMVSDALILQLGGSETTTAASIHILYHLARYPSIQATLFKEISDALPAGQPLNYNAIANLKYLEAIINETLRLHPPGPTGMPRTVPPEGITIEGMYIAGGVDVSTPIYSLHHDPRYFSDPERFIPERWIPELASSSTGLIQDRTAFMTFGFGPYGCAGRHLAYVELKILITGIVRNLEVRFPKGPAANVDEIERRVKGEWRDYSAVHAAPLTLCFVPRDG